MGVQEQLGRYLLETTRLNAARDKRRLLPPEIQECAEQGEQIVNIATEFMEITGIKLALFEFNQDLLNNNGRINADNGFHYIETNKGKSLIYYSRLTLKWATSEDNHYSLVVGIEGDLLETIETDDEDEDEDHVRKLTITLRRAPNPTDAGLLVGRPIEFGSFFDIYDPEAISSSNSLAALEDEEVDTYIDLADKEGTEDIGGSTFKNWTEANIAGFITFIRRELRQDPLTTSAT